MTKVKPFSVNQKFLVSTMSGATFFTTKKQILSGVGENTNFNEAVRYALENFELWLPTDEKSETTGYLSVFRGFTIQLNLR